MAHVPSANTEVVDFMSYTTASHQGLIKIGCTFGELSCCLSLSVATPYCGSESCVNVWHAVVTGLNPEKETTLL